MMRIGGGRALLGWGILAFVATGQAGSPAAAQRAPGLHRAALTVDGIQRTFAVYVPRDPRPAPAVVLVLHGGSGGSGARIRGFIGAELEALAEESGFLVAYPDGVDGNWNGCRAGASYSANLRDIDDPGFLRALIGRLSATLGADPDRVYAMGYSNGGHLAYRLALETPAAVRGIAVFGANLPAADGLDCRESRAPVAVMIAAGTADAINPFEGGEVVLPDGMRLGRVRSAAETLSYFGALAGHDGDPERDGVVADDGAGIRVERSGWSRPGRVPVALYTVHGGGHTIPSPTAEFPAFLGPVARCFGAVREAVRFFGLRDGGYGPTHTRTRSLQLLASSTHGQNRGSASCQDEAVDERRARHCPSFWSLPGED